MALRHPILPTPCRRRALFPFWLTNSRQQSPSSEPRETTSRGELSWRAYHPEIWGTSITIIRRVWKKKVLAGFSSTRQGRGGEQDDPRQAAEEGAERERWATDRSEFALLAGPGGTVEGLQVVKKEEVHAVLRHFGLDFSNPVAYLTQDKSKTFLVSARDEDLYAFFTEVTGQATTDNKACPRFCALATPPVLPPSGSHM